MAGGEKIIQGLREAVDHARQERAVSEQRTTFERLCRNHAQRAAYNLVASGDNIQEQAERYADRHWPAYAGEVREDLAELREPDAAMVDAGDRAFVAHQMAAGGQAHRAAFGAGYRAAIDAIVKGES